MNSQKPTTNEEKSVTTGVVILALLASAIGLGVVKCGKVSDSTIGESTTTLASEASEGNLDHGSADAEGLSSSAPTDANDSGTLEAKYAQLEGEYQTALQENADLNTKLANALSAQGGSATTGAAALAGAALGAQHESNAEGTDLPAELKKMEVSLDAANAQVANLKARNEELSKDAAGNSDSKYDRVRNANEELQRKNSDLEDKLKQAIAGGSVVAPAGDLETELKKRDAEWEQKFAGLLRKSELEKAELVAKIEGKKRNSEASEEEEEQPADAPVFVKSLRDLPAAAQGLFGELKKVEEMKNPNLDKVYDVIKTKTGGLSKGRVKFASGSTTVGPQGRKQVATSGSSIGKDSFVLVVGFADRSGDSTANEKISSARAKAVAAKLQEKLPKGQKIKAVYLGETDRFGAKSQNRVVEIWEIAR